MLDQPKINEMLGTFKLKYVNPVPALVYTSPFELLISTMLAAQCTDKQVNKCTAVLYPKYNTPEAFAMLTEDELFPYIRGCGLYQTKGRNIIKTSQIIMAEHGGIVPNTREELVKLPGVGRKTANVVLSNAFGVPAFAVDTHVFRVSNRIGIASAKDVLGVEKQLMQNIPELMWSDAHHYLIFHGRETCKAQRPLCGECVIAHICEWMNKAAT